MQVQIRHQPSFAVTRLMLSPGEPTQVEAGAMLATSYRGQVQSSSQGGVLKGFGEGLLFDFAGPGQVLTQTGNPSAPASWVIAQVPSRG
jgi:uncharacterized protein (AIM24 family)